MADLRFQFMGELCVGKVTSKYIRLQLSLSINPVECGKVKAGPLSCRGQEKKMWGNASGCMLTPCLDYSHIGGMSVSYTTTETFFW